MLGVAIVAVSVLLGARLLGSADDSVSVWGVRTDLPAGAEVTMADVEAVDIRFGSGEVADRYLSADAPLPAGSVAARALDAGELLPRAAVQSDGATTLTEVPLAVMSEAVPATVQAGVRVDVWVTPEQPADDGRVESQLVLDDVVVVAAPRESSALGPSAIRQIIVGLDETEDDSLPEALALLAAGDVLITRQG